MDLLNFVASRISNKSEFIDLNGSVTKYEKLVINSLNLRLAALMFFICLHNQLSFFNSIIVQMSGKRVHQVHSENEWLLLSVTLTAKLGLVFVLTFKNAFS